MRDYKQTTSGDLALDGGDLEVVESTYQHQRDLLLSSKGHIRDKAESGVGIVNFLHDNDPEGLLRSARKEFAADGMKVKKVGFNPVTNELETEATYENS